MLCLQLYRKKKSPQDPHKTRGFVQQQQAVSTSKSDNQLQAAGISSRRTSRGKQTDEHYPQVVNSETSVIEKAKKNSNKLLNSHSEIACALGIVDSKVSASGKLSQPAAASYVKAAKKRRSQSVESLSSETVSTSLSVYRAGQKRKASESNLNSYNSVTEAYKDINSGVNRRRSLRSSSHTSLVEGIPYYPISGRSRSKSLSRSNSVEEIKTSTEKDKSLSPEEVPPKKKRGRGSRQISPPLQKSSLSTTDSKTGAGKNLASTTASEPVPVALPLASFAIPKKRASSKTSSSLVVSVTSDTKKNSSQKSSKQVKKSHLLDSKRQSTAESLRRSRRSRKTGSCASSR